MLPNKVCSCRHNQTIPNFLTDAKEEFWDKIWIINMLATLSIVI